MTRLQISALLLIGLSLAPLSAFAHGGPIGPRGGMQVHAGPLHQELLVAEGVLTFNIYTIQSVPVSTGGATGTATLLVDGKPVQVALKPAGGNSLTAPWPQPLLPGTRIATIVTLAGKGQIQARYEWQGEDEHAAH